MYKKSVVKGKVFLELVVVVPRMEFAGMNRTFANFSTVANFATVAFLSNSLIKWVCFSMVSAENKKALQAICLQGF